MNIKVSYAVPESCPSSIVEASARFEPRSQRMQNLDKLKSLFPRHDVANFDTSMFEGLTTVLNQVNFLDDVNLEAEMHTRGGLPLQAWLYDHRSNMQGRGTFVCVLLS